MSIDGLALKSAVQECHAFVKPGLNKTLVISTIIQTYEQAKETCGKVPVSPMEGARAMHNYAYTNDLSERDGFIREEYLDNAKACAEAWGLLYVD